MTNRSVDPEPVLGHREVLDGAELLEVQAGGLGTLTGRELVDDKDSHLPIGGIHRVKQRTELNFRVVHPCPQEETSRLDPRAKGTNPNRVDTHSDTVRAAAWYFGKQQ